MKRSALLNLVLVSSFTISYTTAIADDLDKLIKQCGMCHGQDGNSPSSTIPSIAQFPMQYFLHTMDAYKNDGRKSEMMKSFVHTLTEHQLVEIGYYYEKQKYIPREQKFDADKAAKGKVLHHKYCEKCHENEGRVTDNNYGVLAGQWIPYNIKAIKDYLDGNRKVAPMMVTKLKALKKEAGDEGIEQLAHFYASVK